jgi:hypothetical protein
MATHLNPMTVQYYMTTYSTSHRVNGGGHPLDGRLRGYSQGLVPWVTGYDPEI